MRNPTFLSAALAIVSASLLQAAPLEARQSQGSPAGSGAFAAQYPELHELLLAVEAVHWTLLDRLAFELPQHPTRDEPSEALPRSGPDGAEAAIFEHLVGVLSGGDPGEVRTALPVTGATGQRLARMVQRTHALQREILDIYADPGIGDRIAAVDAAIDRYLTDPEHAISDGPKAIGIMQERAQATAFRSAYPSLHGLVWATRWLQLAAFEPLFLLPTPEDRQAGMRLIRDRFWSKLETPPDGFPVALPMVPTIAPGLLARHARAAAILDNMNVLMDGIAGLLVAAEVTDKEAAIGEVIEQFIDPEYRIARRYDWILLALRHGIYNQGGPAVGTLTRSERNVGDPVMPWAGRLF